MNKQCEIVRDLMPLYIDKACSAPSAQMVEEHLKSCDECAGIFEELKSSKYDIALSMEKDEVLTRHAKTEKKKSFLVGAGIACILCIPILVCLIVNPVVSHGLSWFYIVAASLLVFASLTVVPLMANKNKGLWALVSFTVSLILLLLVCAMYTGGSWFFVASSAVLFGLSVVFTPYVLHVVPVPGFWSRSKGLLSMSIDTILLGGMLVSIGIRSGTPSYWVITPQIFLVGAGFVWVLFLLCRYLKVSKLIRFGIASILTGGYTFIADNIIAAILGESRPLPRLCLGVWNAGTIDGNIHWLTLIVLAALGAVCIAIGAAGRSKK